MSKDLDIVQPSTDLILNKTVNQLIIDQPEHGKMLSIIEENLPEIKRGSNLFFKTQSQFMDNMLTVSHLTPLRNARQILAEMNKTTEAVKEFHFKVKKSEINIKMKERDLIQEQDHLKRDLLELEIMELMSQLETSKGYLSGAIRKLTNYSEQYVAILKAHGKENFTEEDFEKEEEEYHIKKAFEQGITAARSRGGIIDEGNLIYFNQIGINGAAAQKDVIDYLNAENNLFKDNKEPTHAMFLLFLDAVYKKYSGSAKKLAEFKGMLGTVSKDALLIQHKEDAQ